MHILIKKLLQHPKVVESSIKIQSWRAKNYRTLYPSIHRKTSSHNEKYLVQIHKMYLIFIFLMFIQSWNIFFIKKK